MDYYPSRPATQKEMQALRDRFPMKATQEQADRLIDEQNACDEMHKMSNIWS